ncbi:hypothetical protein EHO61_03580 [Leptospira fluminis]|uniref:Uncharacterized protein n=1 Tax=Leptospira fluminis TaxID=2484979 RepID=A0A4V3JET3_9LEPT|nr:hypothetical protein [Leptospira fluminis]TGK20949.1 hypothetical protein EHO61_03580 [Leptospira fluminis]
MKKISKLHVAYVIPFVLLVVCLFQLFLQPTFLDANDTTTMESMLDGSGREPMSGFYFQGGTISQMLLTQKILSELSDNGVPTDSQPEDTIDRIGRILLGLRIQIFFYFFLGFLSVACFLSLYYRAFFYSFLNRILYVFGIVYSVSILPTLLGAAVRTSGANFWGFPTVLLVLGWIVFLAYMTVSIKSVFNDAEADRFSSLRNLKEEEAEFRTGSKAESETILLSVLHFLSIILLGALVGNLVYIPLFMLQKNYTNQFGILMLISLLVLCGFYVRNYLRLGKSSELGKFQNLALGLSYLQMRFVRNILFGVVGFTLVIVFIVFIFSLLIVNINVLENMFPAIDGGQNL